MLITEALSSTTGILKAIVSFQKENAEITYKSQNITIEHVIRIIEELNFEAWFESDIDNNNQSKSCSFKGKSMLF